MKKIQTFLQEIIPSIVMLQRNIQILKTKSERKSYLVPKSSDTPFAFLPNVASLKMIYYRATFVTIFCQEKS